MNKLSSLLAFVALVVIGSSCTKEGRSLIQVTVTQGSGVSGVAEVRLDVSQAGSPLKSASFEWPSSQSSMTVGVYLSDGVSGTVRVEASGLTASGTAVAHGEDDAREVAAGKTVTAHIELLPGAPQSDGGMDGAGGSGGGTGSGGTAGGNGSGGTAGGNGSGGAVDAGIDSPAPGWEAPQVVPIDALNGNSDFTPMLATNAAGAAVLVFLRGAKMYGTYKPAGSDIWQQPTVIEDRGYCTLPSVAIDAAGNAIAAWVQSSSEVGADGGIVYSKGVWISRFAGGQWSQAPYQIYESTETMPVDFAKVVMNPDGKAIIAYKDDSGQLMVKTYTPNTAWSLAARVDSQSSGAYTSYYDKIDLAIDAQGDALVTWWQNDDAATGWSTVFVWQRIISTDKAPAQWPAPGKISGGMDWGNGFGGPVLAMNSDGNAVITWYQQTSSDDVISAVRYQKSNATFVGPETVASLGFYKGGEWPAATMDRFGNATVLWVQVVNGGGSWLYDIFAKRFLVGGSWGSVARVETTPLSGEFPSSSRLGAGVDHDGTVTAVWLKTGYDTSDNPIDGHVWAARCTGGTWSTPVQLDHGAATGNADEPTVAVAPAATGTAYAAFSYYESGVTNSQIQVTEYK